MSQFNRKGYRPLRAKNGIFAIKKDGKMDRQVKRQVKQISKQRQARIRDYKDKLRSAKKNIPLADRAKKNWSQELS